MWCLPAYHEPTSVGRGELASLRWSGRYRLGVIESVIGTVIGVIEGAISGAGSALCRLGDGSAPGGGGGVDLLMDCRLRYHLPARPEVPGRRHHTVWVL